MEYHYKFTYVRVMQTPRSVVGFREVHFFSGTLNYLSAVRRAKAIEEELNREYGKGTVKLLRVETRIGRIIWEEKNVPF